MYYKSIIMNILLTGSNGFIGGHVYQYLKKKHNVTCLVRENKKKIKNTILCDLGNLTELKKKLYKIKFDAVIDCAWDGVESFSRNNQKQNRNILNIHNLLSSLNYQKLKFFISFGSQAEYGPRKNLISEYDILKPKTLYGKIKIKKFNICKKYLSVKKVRFIWLRIFSCYGPNDNDNWLIPYSIKKILNNQSPIITSGVQNWNYLYVSDLVKSLSFVLKTKKTEIYNLANTQTIKIKDVLLSIKNITKKKIKIKFGLKKFRKDQVFSLNANTKKITDLGWRPKISMRSGLKKTINYYKSLK